MSLMDLMSCWSYTSHPFVSFFFISSSRLACATKNSLKAASFFSPSVTCRFGWCLFRFFHIAKWPWDGTDENKCCKLWNFFPTVFRVVIEKSLSIYFFILLSWSVYCVVPCPSSNYFRWLVCSTISFFCLLWEVKTWNNEIRCDKAEFFSWTFAMKNKRRLFMSSSLPEINNETLLQRINNGLASKYSCIQLNSSVLSIPTVFIFYFSFEWIRQLKFNVWYLPEWK